MAFDIFLTWLGGSGAAASCAPGRGLCRLVSLCVTISLGVFSPFAQKANGSLFLCPSPASSLLAAANCLIQLLQKAPTDGPLCDNYVCKIGGKPHSQLVGFFPTRPSYRNGDLMELDLTGLSRQPGSRVFSSSPTALFLQTKLAEICQ